MPAASPPDHALDLHQRAVGVPFTTPMIYGAKARPEPRGGVELLVPNPSGGPGYYVIGLKGLRDFCQLSVHDELLLDRLLELEVVTPSAVRRAARDVAMAGAAGRDAAEAAAAAAEKDDALVQLTSYHLIVGLLKQVGIDVRVLKRPESEGGFKSEVRKRLTSLSPKLGVGVDEVVVTLDEIAFYAAPIGFRGSDQKARHRRILDSIASLADELATWSAVEAEDTRELTGEVIDCARWTIDHGTPAVESCHDLLEDVFGLIKRWCRGEDNVKGRFAYCDWLLDGWQEIIAVWEAAAGEDRPNQRMSLGQIARLLPLTKQLSEEGRVEMAGDDRSIVQSRWVRLFEDWRTGTVLSDLRARAETARAGAA